ncbi:MAG: MAPEG family protein [Gammaproteobacteria bacterium]
MKFSEKQAGVLKRMIAGVIIAIAIIMVGSFHNPFNLDSSLSPIERLSVAITYLLLPTFFLVVCIGRLAKHRFFTPEDIDGGGSSEDTVKAKTLQSLLQNTLEQFSIASTTYLAWAIIMPAKTLSVIPLAAISFAIGRLLFFRGFIGDAPSRALGFTLTFYPSAAMLLSMAGYFIWLQVT